MIEDLRRDDSRKLKKDYRRDVSEIKIKSLSVYNTYKQ